MKIGWVPLRNAFCYAYVQVAREMGLPVQPIEDAYAFLSRQNHVAPTQDELVKAMEIAKDCAEQSSASQTDVGREARVQARAYRRMVELFERRRVGVDARKFVGGAVCDGRSKLGPDFWSGDEMDLNNDGCERAPLVIVDCQESCSGIPYFHVGYEPTMLGVTYSDIRVDADALVQILSTPEGRSLRGEVTLSEEFWRVDFDGQSKYFRPGKGIGYVLTLIRQPGKAFTARELEEAAALSLRERAIISLDDDQKKATGRVVNAIAKCIASMDKELEKLSIHLDGKYVNGIRAGGAIKRSDWKFMYLDGDLVDWRFC